MQNLLRQPSSEFDTLRSELPFRHAVYDIPSEREEECEFEELLVYLFGWRRCLANLCEGY